MNDGFRAFSQPNYDRRIRAWVVFDGVSGTILNREAVRSITRNGTGNYTIELEYPMANKYWAWSGNVRSDGGAGAFGFITSADSDATLTTRVIRTVGVTLAGAVAAYDPDEVTVIIVGE
jgi:hypothetical protein